MRTLAMAGLMLAGTLAGCGEKAEQPTLANAGAAAAGAAGVETGAAAEVARLDEATRNVVLERAIKASGAACPAVTASTRVDVRPGVPGWKAQCDNDSAHLIEILPDGTGKVTSRTY